MNGTTSLLREALSPLTCLISRPGPLVKRLGMTRCSMTTSGSEGDFLGYQRSETTPLQIQSCLDFRTGPLPTCATALPTDGWCSRADLTTLAVTISSSRYAR